MTDEIWKKANGDDLPDYGREVVVLFEGGTQEYEVHDWGDFQVGVSYRPYPKGYKFITGEIQQIEEQTYGDGCWEREGVMYWLDSMLPPYIPSIAAHKTTN